MVRLERVGKKEPDVRITMDFETAQVLRAILGMVGGKHTGPRGRSEDIWQALVSEGIVAGDVVVSGSITLS